ncbi:MAG: response regulator [Patescibacteria group bacterium]|nr:response regulator [Patescibacteria group bacterium]
MAKILLIEDDPLMVRMYQRKFKADGHDLGIALDGEEGLVKVREFKPDLVLLDIMMPKLDGLEVLKRMKADSKLKSIPVILLTNLGASEEDVNRGLELGAVAYLIKSEYQPDEVVTKVKEILAGYTHDQEIPKVSGAKKKRSG